LFKSIYNKTGIKFPEFIRIALQKIGVDGVSDFQRLKDHEIEDFLKELERKVLLNLYLSNVNYNIRSILDIATG
jgi:hypothetical protein